MNELVNTLVGDAAAAPPSHIIDALPDYLAHATIAGAPRTIYKELWHITFWQQVTLDWCNLIETPFPDSPSGGFPATADIQVEPWPKLCERFLAVNAQTAIVAADEIRLEDQIRCPSRASRPTRIMTVREQLENLAAHNAYHFGRIVLLRQLLNTWPFPGGGYTWLSRRIHPQLIKNLYSTSERRQSSRAIATTFRHQFNGTRCASCSSSPLPLNSPRRLNNPNLSS